MGKWDRARQEREERRAAAAAGGGGKLWFSVKSGEEQIRFVEKLSEIETHSAYFHEMPPQPPAKKYTWFEICLDQDDEGARTGADCPGCEANRDDYNVCRRKFIGYANVIWRNAPVRKIENGKVTVEGTKDQIALWEIKPTVQDLLTDKELTYKDLTSRDFIVRRRGTGFDTTYSLEPVADEKGDVVAVPLTDVDKELIGEGVNDIPALLASKPISEWGIIKTRKKEEGEGAAPADGKASDSPFLRRNQQQQES